MADRKREASVAADASHPFSVQNTVFINTIGYESAEGSPMPGSRPLRIWMKTIFTTCENAEFWTRGVAAVLGHSDSSSRSEQSTPEVVWQEFRDGVPAIFILRLVCSRE
jgi:hypothetical protein